MSGIVHLVGAGPGDPELISVKGARLIGEADAIVHDRLVARELLALARSDARRFDVGKDGLGASVPQGTTTALLISLAGAGLRVVRLKSGDPFVFGRGGEELVALRAAGVAVEVVPGISAGLAAPAAAGIPITHRGVSRSVLFVTGATAEGEGPLVDDPGALAAADTLVVFMGGRSARGIAGALLRAGRVPHTPVAVVISATQPDEEVRITDLAGLAATGANVDGHRPVVLLIGDVVAVAGSGEGTGRDTIAAWIGPTAWSDERPGPDAVAAVGS